MKFYIEKSCRDYMDHSLRHAIPEKPYIHGYVNRMTNKIAVVHSESETRSERYFLERDWYWIKPLKLDVV